MNRDPVAQARIEELERVNAELTAENARLLKQSPERHPQVCCSAMQGQMVKCDQHPEYCPDMVVKWSQSTGRFLLKAENATYSCHYCPWCGTDLEYLAKGKTATSLQALSKLRDRDMDAYEGLATPAVRHTEGRSHHPLSRLIINEMAHVDWEFNNGELDIRVGGDGDNGEAMMFCLDMLFERLERRESQKDA